MKNTKKTQNERPTIFTVTYPDGQSIVMHNSNDRGRFEKCLDQAKVNGIIRRWVIGDHKHPFTNPL